MVAGTVIECFRECDDVSKQKVAWEYLRIVILDPPA